MAGAQHSYTFHLNLEPFRSLKPPKMSYKKYVELESVRVKGSRPRRGAGAVPARGTGGARRAALRGRALLGHGAGQPGGNPGRAVQVDPQLTQG